MTPSTSTVPRARVVAGLVAFGCLVPCAIGCSAGSGRGSDAVVLAAASSVAPTLAGSIDVGVLGDLEVSVDLTAASSSVLARQISDGAPVDVFVSADRRHVAELVEKGVVAEMARLVGNELVVAVPAGSEAVADLGDLARPDVSVGLCDAAVPCGTYARDVIDAGGLDPHVVTTERNVGSLTQKLLAGELDAGFVYATDVVAHAGELEALPLSQPGDDGVGDAGVSVWVGLVDGSSADAESVYRALLGPGLRTELLAAGFVP